jgi:hypothetical protein
VTDQKQGNPFYGATAHDKPSLVEAMRRAREWFDGLSPEEQEAHLKAQKEGWVRSEMSWGDEGTRAAR